MRTYARIIAEYDQTDCWKAWFAVSPDVKASSDSLDEAIVGLLLVTGIDEYDPTEISEIENASLLGHFEFRIPFRPLRYLPMPSRN